MWQISYPPANGACPGSYFWGACAQQQKFSTSLLALLAGDKCLKFKFEIVIEIEIVYFYSHHMKFTGLDFRA